MIINNKNLCTLYIVRHGESEANVLDAARKHYDVGDELGLELTKKGQQQAAKLGKKFKDIHFDAIYSSDLLRAHQTAKIIALEKKIAVITTSAIRERGYGRWRGKYHLVKKQIIEQINQLIDEQKMKFEFDDMETEESGSIRLITFIREVAVAYEGKTVLIVCHGNIMRMLLIKLGYGTYSQLPSGSVANTGYFIIESDGTDFFLKEVVGIKRPQD